MSEADHSSERRASPPSDTDDRLDSWKEIAAFLERDVRTVQRWEKYAALPVHRHAESRLRTAYAYRTELEGWWRMQRSTVEPGDAADVPILASSAPAGAAESQPARGRRPPSHHLRALSVIGSITVVAIIVALWFRSAPDVRPASTANRPVAVVVTRFENRAENPELTSAIEETVARELAGSGQLETVTPARIARTLRLMRRDPTALLGEALGRELVVRDPHIKYVIAGRVRAFEAKYFADVRAVDAEGRAHATVEWQAETAEQLISQSRKRLGRFAELAARSVVEAVRPVEPPEDVTSSSTEAVGLYTAALQAAVRGQWGASELLARRAIVLDPDFAAAHAWVGWTMRKQGRSTFEALPFLERALLLSSDVTDQETYLVSGMFHSAAGDLRAAAAALEALRRLTPSHRQALDMLIEVSWRLGRVRRAVELSIFRAEAYPDDFYANVRAAQALAAVRGNTERAAAFAGRAKRLASAESVGDRPAWNAWLHVLPVFQRWVDGDMRGARQGLDELDRSLPDRLGRERDAFAAAVGFAHLAFGRAQRAEHAFRFGSAPDRQMNLAVLALIQSDEETARQWLGQVREHGARSPALFARLGFTQEAERGLASMPPSDHAEGVAAVTRGLLALRRRQLEPATASLRQGLDLLRSSGEPAYFFAAEALASIADARGDVGRSIRLLTDAAAERAHTYGDSQWTAAYWIRMSTELVRLHRRAGHHDEAEQIHVGLRQVLDVGDLREPAVAASGAR